jgi:hypothetical protein
VFELTTLVVIVRTDSTGSYKANYHTITITFIQRLSCYFFYIISGTSDFLAMNVYTSNIATSQTDLTGKSNFERDLNVKLGFDPNWKAYVYVNVSYDLFPSKTMVKHKFWKKQLFYYNILR